MSKSILIRTLGYIPTLPTIYTPKKAAPAPVIRKLSGLFKGMSLACRMNHA